MKLPERGWYNGAQRRAQLLGKGNNVMFMGENGTVDTSPSWSAGLLDFVKSASALVNQQRVFNYQLTAAHQSGQPIVQPGQAPQVQIATNWGRIALLGAAGVLGIVLLTRVMR
jgi:hypothetical protein